MIADRTGKSRSRVVHAISVNNLIEKIKEHTTTGYAPAHTSDSSNELFAGEHVWGWTDFNS